MSKAFTSEENAPDPVVVRPRAPLPAGCSRTTSPAAVWMRCSASWPIWSGSAPAPRSRSVGPEDQARAAALATRMTELAGRVHGAVLVDPPGRAPRRGAVRRHRDWSGTPDGRERRLQIVGVDEANGREGKVAFVAPMARALLGRRRGDLATLRSPRGEEELEVVDIEYDTGGEPVRK